MIQSDLNVLLMFRLMNNPEARYRISHVSAWFPAHTDRWVAAKVSKLVQSRLLYDSRQTGIGITEEGIDLVESEIYNPRKTAGVMSWRNRALTGINADGTPAGIVNPVIPKQGSPFAVMPPDMEGLIDELWGLTEEQIAEIMEAIENGA